MPPVMIAAVELWMPMAVLLALTRMVPEFVMPPATWSATGAPFGVKPTVMPTEFVPLCATIVPEFAIPPPIELGVLKLSET